MPRTLSPEHKAAMAEGRARYVESERERSAAEWVAYRKWLRRDRELYAALERARDGGTPQEVAIARSHWRSNLRELRVPSGAPPE